MSVALCACLCRVCILHQWVSVKFLLIQFIGRYYDSRIYFIDYHLAFGPDLQSKLAKDKGNRDQGIRVIAFAT